MHFDKVVLQNREPNTDALWAKPDGDKISWFIYNNGKWVPIGGPFTYQDFTEEQLESLRGPQGIQGPQGPQGLEGPAGPQGPQGPQGDSVLVGQGDLPLAHVLGQDNTKAMSQKGVTDALDDMFGLITESTPMNFNELTVQNCSLGSPNWYLSGYTHAQRHVAVPVIPGETIEITANSEYTEAFYGFLTSSYNPPVSNGSAVPYVSGTNRMTVSSNQKYIVIIPNGCAYLALNTVDGAGNEATWTINKIVVLKSRVDTLEDRTDSLEDRADMLEQEVLDLKYKSTILDTDTNIYGWYIAADTLKWRESSTYQCKLIDISSLGGMSIQITKNPNGACRYAFLETASPSQNADVDFCDGTTLVEVASGSVIDFIPNNAAYLYLYAKSSATDVTPTIEVRKARTHTPIKLRVAHWNIGHFSLGTASDTIITHEQYPTMRQKWAETINGIDADIFLCCEYNANMVNALGGQPVIKAKDAIFSLYPFAHIGSQPLNSKYVMCAMFANYRITDVKEVVYDNTYVAGRYYMTGVINFDDTSVHIVETHLDWSENATATADRAAQIQQLIDDFAEYDYVIIAADWNVNGGSSEYDVLAEAGYSMVNHGYLGDFNTYPAGNAPSQPLDNIVCKGFAINGIHVVNDNTLTDHCAIYADFTLIR